MEIPHSLRHFLNLKHNKCMGIDIGTYSIKMVELSRKGSRFNLENYGEMKAQSFFEKPYRLFEKNTLSLLSVEISKAIKAILEEAQIDCKCAVFSIPDYSTFFTSFELPQMSGKELSQAVYFEARQHIPLPLSEVVYDWQIISSPKQVKEGGKIKIILVAVPKEIINQYQEIAALSNLEALGFEAEVYGLMKSLVKDKKAKELKEDLILVDIGAQSTTINIVKGGILEKSHSFDISSNGLIQLLSQSHNVNFQEAEDLIRKYGIIENKGNAVKNILSPVIDILLSEIRRISQDFFNNEKGEFQKIVLAGSSALMPGLKDYFSDYFKKETIIADPFSDIFFPPILSPVLKEMGPSFSIAVGMAIHGVS